MTETASGRGTGAGVVSILEVFMDFSGSIAISHSGIHLETTGKTSTARSPMAQSACRTDADARLNTRDSKRTHTNSAEVRITMPNAAVIEHLLCSLYSLRALSGSSLPVRQALLWKIAMVQHPAELLPR